MNFFKISPSPNPQSYVGAVTPQLNHHDKLSPIIESRTGWLNCGATPCNVAPMEYCIVGPLRATLLQCTGTVQVCFPIPGGGCLLHSSWECAAWLCCKLYLCCYFSHTFFQSATGYELKITCLAPPLSCSPLYLAVLKRRISFSQDLAFFMGFNPGFCFPLGVSRWVPVGHKLLSLRWVWLVE